MPADQAQQLLPRQNWPAGLFHDLSQLPDIQFQDSGSRGRGSSGPCAHLALAPQLHSGHDMRLWTLGCICFLPLPSVAPCFYIHPAGAWYDLAGALRPSAWYPKRGDAARAAGPPIIKATPPEPKLHQGDPSGLSPGGQEPIGLQPEESHDLARRGMAGKARKYSHTVTVHKSSALISPCWRYVIVTWGVLPMVLSLNSTQCCSVDIC